MKAVALTFILLPLAPAFAGIPSWVQNRETQIRNGNQLELVCMGEGPSLELARRSARESCQVTASDHLSTTLRVRTVSVETERDVTLHQDVTEDRKIAGLQCDLQKESIEELESQVKVYQLCKFDLDKVTITTTPEVKEPRSVNSSELGSLAPRETPSPGRHLASSERRILLAVAPACDSILVEGEKLRIIRCAGNPQAIVLGDGDQRITVRSKGFMPRSITIPAGGLSNDEPIQVLLERAD